MDTNNYVHIVDSMKKGTFAGFSVFSALVLIAYLLLNQSETRATNNSINVDRDTANKVSAQTGTSNDLDDSQLPPDEQTSPQTETNNSAHTGPFDHSFAGRDSLGPDLPRDVFQRHISAAKAGDTTAMYWIVRVHRECRKVPSTPEALENYFYRHPHMTEWTDEITASYNRCSPLFEWLPGVDHHSAEQDWLAKAAEADYALAKIEILQRQGDNPRKHMQILQEAMYTGGYEAYYLASDLTSAKNGHSLESDAWELLGCTNHPACSREFKIEQLSHDYLPREVEEILRLSKHMSETIAKRRTIAFRETQ